MFEAKSTVRTKMRKGYEYNEGDIVEASEGTIVNTKVRPQLVAWYKDRQRFLDKEDEIDFQDKYDGMRALWNTKTSVFSTRSSKQHSNNLPHIKSCLEDVKHAFEIAGLSPCPEYLDGELYSFERSFQETCSILKQKTQDANDIVFMIFDFVDSKMPWTERRNVLDKVKFNLMSKAETSPVKIVETRQGFVKDLDRELNDAVSSRNNEGIIMRLPQGVYRTNGARSNMVIKAKYFYDDEFKIVGMELESKTTDMCGSIVFQLNDGTNRTFNARPGFKEDPDNHWGTEEGRRELWSKKDEICFVFNNDGTILKEGKIATVRYQELTDSGIPRFPNMINFRNKIE